MVNSTPLLYILPTLVAISLGRPADGGCSTLRIKPSILFLYQVNSTVTFSFRIPKSKPKSYLLLLSQPRLGLPALPNPNVAEPPYNPAPYVDSVPKLERPPMLPTS